MPHNGAMPNDEFSKLVEDILNFVYAQEVHPINRVRAMTAALGVTMGAAATNKDALDSFAQGFLDHAKKLAYSQVEKRDKANQ